MAFAFVPPTEEEIVVVQKLKSGLEEHATGINLEISPFINETTILRFLREFKGNEAVALDHLVKHAIWRVEKDVDNIMCDMSYQKLLDRNITIFTGNDVLDRPVAFTFIHRHNAYDRDIDQVRSFLIYTLENQLMRSDPDNQQFVVVFDLSRFSLQSFDMEYIKEFLMLLDTQYPSACALTLILDAPFIFSACWAMIKPLISSDHIDQVIFLSRAQLTDYIEESQLPNFEEFY
jgi:hypothetical protein